jgi:hypothetical protein
VRHGRGPGGEGAMRRCEVGEGPGPTSRQWAAGTSPATMHSGGRRAQDRRQDRGGRGGGSLMGGPRTIV